VKILVALASLALAGLILACSPASSSPTPTVGPTGSSPASGSPAAAVACVADPVPDGAQVSIVDFEFQPAEITINAGDIVTWTDSGQAPHTATLDDGPTCDDERMSPGGQHSVQFNASGEYRYHCEIHRTMHAKVIVQP
jgi:plastocyanin